MGRLQRIAVVLSLVAGWSGCRKSSAAEAAQIAALEKACTGMKAGDVLALDTVFSSDWDRVVAVGPYTPEGAIVAALGKPLPSTARDIAVEGRDDIYMLLFVSRDQGVAAVAVPRRVMNISKRNLLQPIPREQARFVLGDKREFTRAGASP
jgi:hypothetical protein